MPQISLETSDEEMPTVQWLADNNVSRVQDRFWGLNNPSYTFTGSVEALEEMVDKFYHDPSLAAFIEK